MGGWACCGGEGICGWVCCVKRVIEWVWVEVRVGACPRHLFMAKVEGRGVLHGMLWCVTGAGGIVGGGWVLARCCCVVGWVEGSTSGRREQWSDGWGGLVGRCGVK